MSDRIPIIMNLEKIIEESKNYPDSTGHQLFITKKQAEEMLDDTKKAEHLEIMLKCYNFNNLVDFTQYHQKIQKIFNNLKKEINIHRDYLKLKRTLWLISHEICNKELQLLEKIQND